MKRKGVVLFMSVALIAVLIPLIWQSMSLFKDVVQQGEKEKFFVTKNLILKDISKALNKRAKDIKKSEDLDSFFVELPPIISAEDFLHVSIQIKPVFDKINLNKLYYKNKQDAYITSFIHKLSEHYGLRNSTFLLNLLLDTIDEDEEERDAFSEIVLSDKDFRNGSIFSVKHLELIKDFYYEQTRDESIYHIPWKEYVYFGKKDVKSILDCERVSSKLLEFLDFEGDLSDGCALENTARNNALKSAVLLEPFSKSKEYLVSCIVEIQKNEENQSFEILHDINKNQINSLKRVWK